VREGAQGVWRMKIYRWVATGHPKNKTCASGKTDTSKLTPIEFKF
jgi:hypothetical protein